MPSLALLQRHLWVSSRKLAEKHLGHARQLLSSQDPVDIHTALGLLDTTLKLFPQWEKAIELKARALLCLRRFKDIANLLHESIPSLKSHSALVEPPAEDKVMLLPLPAAATAHPTARRSRKVSLTQCFSLFPLRKRAWVQCGGAKGDREQWKYLVLGQACCHLGLMEDAMILLSNGKRAASAAYRKQSSRFNEDSFVLDGMHGTADVDLVSHLLGNIKLLLRRRTAALAALDAGLYTEAARHFSKIIDGRRGTPQGFIAECYMHRATAHQAANKIIDALADCNRSLALNPMCAEALSARATLYETIGCLPDALQDLGKLKTLYETVFTKNVQWEHTQSAPNSDLQGCIDFINGKLTSILERVNVHIIMDHYLILGVSRGCARAEVERAYLLLSLKHRPDKSAHFVDRVEFVDERDIEAVKDEVRALGLKLFKMLQKAYTWVMSVVLEEEMNRVRHIQEGNVAMKEPPMERSPSTSRTGMYPTPHEMYDLCFCGIGEEAQNLLVEDNVSADAVWLTQQDSHQIEVSSTKTTFKHDVLESHKDLNGFSDIGVGQLADATLFAQVSTCRELAKVGTMLSQGLPAEAWMSSNDWNHQSHTAHALSVT